MSAPRAPHPVVARAACVLALAAGACGENAPAGGGDPQVAYLRDAASRRRALVDSLVNPANGYSELRLARYATGAADDWERLDAWNPLVAPVAPVALDAAPPTPLALPADARALELPDDATWDGSTSLVALGEEAFFRYPAQLAPPALTPVTRDAAQRYGLWLDGTRGVGGVVAVEVAGGTALALSCSSCHADVVGGRLVPGLPSAHLDLGRMIVDSAATDDVTSSNLLAWGPGRNDVTTSDASLPERVSDLRPLRFLSHLQYDATVRQLDVVSLAIRVETLLITSHGQAKRPPRIVALAIAQYLWSLADGLSAPPAAETPGRALFAARCSGCHAGDGFTSVPRPLAQVGTDPRLGLSPDRGTGFYRVPSLRGVGGRPTLFHDGTLPDLDALLDPQRLDAVYAGGARGAGPVSGHAFGLDLSPPDRAALLDYVRSL
ncbi:MAG TPA: c-type cytochrome [Polyangia bacterium]